MPIAIGSLLLLAIAGLTAALILWINRVDDAEQAALAAEAHAPQLERASLPERTAAEAVAPTAPVKALPAEAASAEAAPATASPMPRIADEVLV